MNDLLETNTFTGSPSAFSNVGRIALVLDRISDNKEEFIPLMNEMGEIDKYVSVVRYKQKNTSFISFTYTQPTKTNHPFITTEKIVHPAMPSNKPNTISLGGQNPTTVIVQGDNGCGKSQTAKAVLANTITATTFGFAAAEKFNFSPFNELLYSGNITDDTGTKSRGQAEIEAATTIYQKNQSSQEKNKSRLIVLDEGFSATDSTAGGQCLTDLAKSTTKNDNNINIFITHHKNIPELPEFKFFHVDENNKFIWKPGPATTTNIKELFEKAKKEADNKRAAKKNATPKNTTCNA